MGGLGIYFGVIHKTSDGANYRWMLGANQLTWGLTSFLGLYALFSDTTTALDMLTVAT